MKKKLGKTILCIGIFIIVIHIFILFRNFSYYRVISEAQCKYIKQYCTNHNYNDDICILVDFSRYSGNHRLYIYNLNSNTIELSGKVAHGIGKNPINVFSPKFSNEPNSYNSSLGKYRLGKIRKMNFKGADIPCIELHGLDSTNSNAFNRGILIHTGLMTDFPSILPCEPFSMGCFTVTDDTFETIKSLTQGSKKPILLYAYK